MKKLAAGILLLTYFTVTTGFVVSIHYCMDKPASFEIGYTDKSECGKCGMSMAKSHGCCKDDVRLVKVHLDQNFAKSNTPDFSLAFLPINAFTDFSFSLQLPAEKDIPTAHGPPLSTQDIYLRNRVFRL